ncbi:MAG: Uma2 family endonuclease [Planctomycetota bacterium]
MIVQSDHLDQRPIDLEAMPHWRCSSERYLELIASGTLGPSDKVELINGIITAMSPAGPEHSYVVMQLTELLAPVLPTYRLLVQGTVHIASGQVFDPDLAVIKRRGDDTYKHRHAGPDDIPLVIEAALSSMKRDAQVKMPIYAAAGIFEYWIVDIENKTLIVHRDPTDNGYGLIQKFTGETPVSAASVDGLTLTPASIFA